MEDVNKIYHDKEIAGIYYEKENKVLRLLTVDNEEISFKNVIQVELNYFSDQNILFDILKYNFESIPNSIKLDYPFLGNEKLSKTYSIYFLDSSSGLTGIIICNEHS